MAQQGIDRIIGLKGIVRNTAGSASPDGELEEVIGLRYKDGSWRPCGELKSIGSASGYTQLYVHTNLYHHLLGVKDGILYWIGDINDGVLERKEKEVSLCNVKTSQINIAQTGHLITIASREDGIQYLLFREENGAYGFVEANFNGGTGCEELYPNGSITFKVDLDKKTINDKLLTLLGTIEEKISVGNDLNSIKPIEIKKRIAESADAVYVAAKHAAAVNNWLTDVHMICTALELYDGTYILQSQPAIINIPSVNSLRDQKYIYESTEQNLYKIIEGQKIVASEYVTHSYSGDLDWGGKNQKQWDESELNIFRNVRNLIHKPENSFKEFTNTMYTNVDIKKIFRGDKILTLTAENADVPKPVVLQIHKNSDKTEYGNAYISKQTLYYKVEKNIDESFKDIIKSIGVFITKGVDVYKHDCYSDYRIIGDSNTIKYIDETTNLVNPTGNDLNQGVYDLYMPIKTNKEIIDELMNQGTFYKIASIPTNTDTSVWQELTIEKDAINNLIHQERLSFDSFSRNDYAPNSAFTYNGRLHIADYEKQLFKGYPLNYFFSYPSEGQWNVKKLYTDTRGKCPIGYIVVKLETPEGEKSVIREYRYAGPRNIYSLNPIIAYPDRNAKEIKICTFQDIGEYGTEEIRWREYEGTYALKAHAYMNMAYYVHPEIKPIDIIPPTEHEVNVNPVIPSESTYKSRETNVLKVSAVDNPLIFPNANTYQIGNSTIIGFATNTTALSTGQFGDAPLYVFTKDGIYGLFVDTSGQMTYSNSRPISREICNNANSITPIDGGVLFTTDRGLMLLRGAEVIDLSDSIEGCPFLIEDINELYSLLNNPKLVTLHDKMSKENFLEYIKGSKIGYNYFDKEIWISNPAKKYSYVYNMKIEGWSKRVEVVREFVNDYPKLYALDKLGNMKDVSVENISLTQTMFLTRPIKLETQEFKQNYRTILRAMIERSLNFRDFRDCEYAITSQADIKMTTDIKKGEYVRIAIIDPNDIWAYSPLERYIKYTGPKDDPRLNEIFDNYWYREYNEENLEKPDERNKISGCLYLFGSYDCKSWALLGGNQKEGIIRDIGLIANRSDCKYFRVLFTGNLSEGSSIEHIEMSAEARLLAGKLR